MASPGNGDHDDLQPTFAEGYKIGEKKTVDQYAALDAEDESLARWKASLGITPGGTSAPAGAPKIVIHTVFLASPTLKGRRIVLDLLNSTQIASLKKNPITIKEGVEYNVGITFKVNSDVITGLRYLHKVTRAKVTVDKLEAMIGSFGPSPTLYTNNFHSEEAPSGMLARSGTYTVQTKITDDDKEVYADFTWSFKIGKEWEESELQSA